jgi:hypothetical protein
MLRGPIQSNDFSIGGDTYFSFNFSDSLMILRGVVPVGGGLRVRIWTHFSCHICCFHFIPVCIIPSIISVTYIPVAKRWLCKQRLLLGNARNIHARNNRRTVFSVARAAAVGTQRCGKHNSNESKGNNRRAVFYMWSVFRCYKQGTKSVEFCTTGCEERTWAREAEDCTVRSRCQGRTGEDTAVWRKAWRMLWVICELWRSAVAL